MAECLTPDEMESLLADMLPPDEKARAEAHLRACEKCREQLEARRADNQLFGEIKLAYREEKASPESDPDATQSGVLDDTSRPPIADTIEGYEILAEVHRGGQGVVYKAVQKATKRTVALKVLLQGPFASPRQRHRFEREIDLIASLQHANIVTVYDSGVTQGRHYFAMEYIHGQSLDAYLSDKNLSIDETLRLFQKICAGVNYAHQRGVIHRDLKPGNIRMDAEGQPHILDFGLAKAAGADLTEGAPVTVTGAFLGTLAYASPEQTKGDPTLIDIRTDVYSLGVILYEMLTGKYPYPVVGQMGEVLRNIAEAEPKKPSTIRRQINDEVETIVLKALAKEKERRYQSAENLARDIEHYLHGEPVDAKRDSAWYVVRKSLRRYRVPVAIAAAFLGVLTGFGVLMWVQAERNRQLAEDERKLRKQAEERELHAAYNAGVAYEALGEYDKAEAAYRRALDLAPTFFSAWFNLGNVLSRGAGRIEEAVTAYQEARRLKPDDTRPLVNLAEMYRESGFWNKALTLFRELRRCEPQGTDWLIREAEMLDRLGEWREAVAAYQEFRSKRPNDLDVLNSLAWLYLTALDPQVREPQAALGLMREVKRVAPGDVFYNNTFALACVENGLVDDARTAVNRSLRALGENPLDLIVLAMCEQAEGSEASAVARLQGARKLRDGLGPWEIVDFDRLLALATSRIEASDTADRLDHESGP